MRKNENNAFIEGYLYSHTLELKVTGEKSKTPGQEYIRGKVSVAVDEEGLNVIDTHFIYVTPIYSKSQKPNPNFAVLKNIIEKNNTWESVGKENALRVKISGSLLANEFYDREGNLACPKRVEASFIEDMGVKPFSNKRNYFKVDMVALATRLVEADEEKNIAEDYLTVGGYVFNFRNEVYPFEFTVRDKNGISFFEDLDISGKNPVYTQVWGSINSLTVVTRKEEESAWGANNIVEYTNTYRSYDITGTKKVPYDFGDEEVMTVEDLETAIQNRNVRLANIKKSAEEFEESKNANFGTEKAATAAPKIPAGTFTF